MNNQFIQRIGIDWNGIGRDSYLRDIDALKGLELLEFGKPVTFFVGENGSGKSNLLEAIAVAYGFNPEGGTKNYSFSTYDSHSEPVSYTHLLNELDNVAADLENAMAGISTVNSIKKRDQADFDRMLDDTMVTAQRLTSASGNLANTLTILQNTLKANRADVESGTEKTLDGLIEIMERAVADSTTTRVKDANEKMKESVKSEIDKVEDETNFLNLDVEQQLISFTSDKNETPASIQIILKTQEISEDSVTDNAVDIEPVVESHGLWYRITQVFVKIWNGIKGIFQ